MKLQERNVRASKSSKRFARIPVLTVRLFSSFSTTCKSRHVEDLIPWKLQDLFCYLLINRNRPLSLKKLALRCPPSAPSSNWPPLVKKPLAPELPVCSSVPF